MADHGRGLPYPASPGPDLQFSERNRLLEPRVGTGRLQGHRIGQGAQGSIRSHRARLHHDPRAGVQTEDTGQGQLIDSGLIGGSNVRRG